MEASSVEGRASRVEWYGAEAYLKYTSEIDLNTSIPYLLVILGHIPTTANAWQAPYIRNYLMTCL